MEIRQLEYFISASALATLPRLQNVIMFRNQI